MEHHKRAVWNLSGRDFASYAVRHGLPDPAIQEPEAGYDTEVVPLKLVVSSYRGPSGPRWCSEFPTSVSIGDLDFPFGQNVERFLAALNDAGVRPYIAATFRPLERAWLMHWAWRIAMMDYEPCEVPAKPGVEIDWVHRDAAGRYDSDASREAAVQMNVEYNTKVKPALTSLHIAGHAIDLSVRWTQTIHLLDGAGDMAIIPPGTGADSLALHAVARSYGIVKRRCDPPHWSVDGR